MLTMTTRTAGASYSFVGPPWAPKKGFIEHDRSTTCSSNVQHVVLDVDDGGERQKNDINISHSHEHVIYASGNALHLQRNPVSADQRATNVTGDERLGIL